MAASRVKCPPVLSTFNCEELEADVAQAQKEGNASIIIDLSQTRFIDTSGISALMRLSKAPHFKLAAAQGRVAQMLSKAGI